MSTQKDNSHIPLTPGQCRGARGMLGWSQDELASASQVSVSTIASFERGERTPTKANLGALKLAFEGAGLVFLPINGGGVGIRFGDPEHSK